MTGESQVEEPRTEAGRALGGRLWGTPSTDAAGIGRITAGIFRDIVRIEAEARAAAFAAAEEAVAGLEGQCHSRSGLMCEASPCVENVARAAVLAAITALRQPQEAKDTRGEDR